MAPEPSIVKLLNETRSVLAELHRLGLPGLDPRLPMEIIEYNLHRPPEEHILLLEETFLLTPYRMKDGIEHDPITEARLMAEASGNDDPDNIVLRGVFQRAEKKNQNGRIYPLDLLSREVKKLQEPIKDNRLVGELDHPQSAKIRVPPTSHKITKLWMEDGNEAFGELVPTHNTSGRDLHALIVKDKVRLGVSSRGTGTLKETDEGLIVQPNFQMITFDIVADPSTHGAFPEEVREDKKRRFLSSVASVQEDIGEGIIVNETLVQTTRKLLEMLKGVGFGKRI